MAVRAAVTKRKAKVALEAQAPLVGCNIVRVGTSVGLTLNMGNYESLRLECSMEAEIHVQVDVDKARAHLMALCTAQLQRDYDNGDWPLIERN